MMGLRALRVDPDAEGRVFLGEALQGLRHVRRGLALLGLDREIDDRLRDVHRTAAQVGAVVAEGVTRSAIDAEERDDVAARGFLDVLHLVRQHADQTADLVLLVGAGVPDGVALLQRALIDADVGQLTVGAVLELERVREEGILRGVRHQSALFLVLGVECVVLDVAGLGQVGHDRVEQRLDAAVLVGRTEEDRAELEGEDALAHRRVDHLLGDVLLLEDRFHQLVAEVGDRVEHHLAAGFRLDLELGRDLLLLDLLTVRAVEGEGLHLDEIHDTVVLGLEADRDLHHDRVQTELLAQLVAATPAGLAPVRSHLLTNARRGTL